MIRIAEHGPAEGVHGSGGPRLSQDPGGFVSQVGELAILQGTGNVVYGIFTQIHQGPCRLLAFKVVITLAEHPDQFKSLVHADSSAPPSFKLC